MTSEALGRKGCLVRFLKISTTSNFDKGVDIKLPFKFEYLHYDYFKRFIHHFQALDIHPAEYRTHPVNYLFREDR